MKNEELINLQGGYYTTCFLCKEHEQLISNMLDSTEETCDGLCKEAYEKPNPEVKGEWNC